MSVHLLAHDWIMEKDGQGSEVEKHEEMQQVGVMRPAGLVRLRVCVPFL
jgi:hypothetical protein